MISHMLRLKIVPDPECKISMKSFLGGSIYTNAANLNSENGLILNWNNLEPKLNFVYESWLLESSRYFKKGIKSSKSFTLKKLKEKQHHFSSSYNVEQYQSEQSNDTGQEELLKRAPAAAISSKKLHFIVITRIDLSSNNLEAIPFAIFQIESLKFLKLSQNRFLKIICHKLI